MSNGNSQDSKMDQFRQMMEDMRKDYLLSFPHRIASIRSYMSENKWQCVHQEYHKLKGSGKTYGFAEISIICEVLETLSTDPPRADIRLFEDAISLLERLHQSYLKNRAFDLKSDPVAARILALK